MISKDSKFVNPNFLKLKWDILKQVQLDVKISEGARLLYSHLTNFCVDKNGQCWPGIKLLAAKFTKNEKTIRRYLKELERAGYVTIKKRRNKSAIIVLECNSGSGPDIFVQS